MLHLNFIYYIHLDRNKTNGGQNIYLLSQLSMDASIE